MNSQFLKVKSHSPFTMEKLEGKNALYILRKGVDIFNKFGYNPNLGGGTLLGLVRDGELIKHDTDLDVDLCIDDVGKFNTTMNDINNSMEQEGFKLCRTQTYNGKFMQIAYYHTETKIIFDVYCYYKKFDWYMNVSEHGLLGYPKFAWEHRTKLMEYDIPAHTTEYLEQRYGMSWNKPQNEKGAWEKDAENLMVIL